MVGGMKLKQPLRDRVVIEVIGQDKTRSGLWIPEVAQKDKQTAIGRVVAVGPGIRVDVAAHRRDGADSHQELNAELVPMDSKVGDHVVFMRYSGVEVSIDGKPFVMVRDHEILATVEIEPSDAVKSLS
jgi:chaperonin GroES